METMRAPSRTVKAVLNASRVRELLELEELSQRDLADRLKVSPSTVSDWLSGKATPGKAKLDELAEILDADADELLLPFAPVTIGSNSVVYVYNVYNVAAGATVTTHIHNTGAGSAPETPDHDADHAEGVRTS